MPTAPDNHDAHDYAERIRDRLPRRLQELREACGLSMYGLARENDILRKSIGKIKSGFICPTMVESTGLTNLLAQKGSLLHLQASVVG
ncbi:MAG: hypothetical protein KGQ89_09460 [Verrucomicrobia bacterium]|nr:hypothetical protein [Verrucomicrobiota bacterium]